MSTSNVAEIIQGDLPSFAIRRPSTFLSLAPTTSASYPRRPSSPPAITAAAKIASAAAATAAAAAATGVTTTETAPIAAPTAEETELGLLKHRRSSSLASVESGSKLRFLKLGPVHWGEGDGTGDWSEVGVPEE